MLENCTQFTRQSVISGLLRQTAEFDYIRNFNLRKWSLTQMVTPWTLRKMSHRKLRWLCANVNMLKSPNHGYAYYSQSSDVEHVLVYQNYGLWCMTQCELDKSGDVCETRSYYLINSVDHSTDYEMHIANLEDEPTRYFDGNGLVFNYTFLRNTEIMYTTALALSLYILYCLYCVRKQEQKHVSKQRWVCLSVFAFISGVLVSNTVNEFKQKGFKLGDVGDGGDNYNEVKPGLAIYFGGVGAVACFLSMACMIAILNIQTQCCIASSDTSTVSQVDCIQPQTTECEMELQQQNENVKVENNA